VRSRPYPRDDRAVRPATTITLALLLTAIFIAALIQFLVIGR
jgi:hypothetical protein